MPFIPHTEEERDAMLATIGVKSVADLFDEIPAALINQAKLDDVPSQVSEMDLGHLMQARAKQDEGLSCFIGAGAYEHHIPAAVWNIAGRGEFYSAYTPYQAEASQGTLQLLYEFQSMITSLTGLDAANASMYDGASAVAEAVLMAVRSNKRKPKQVAVPESLHPHYRQVIENIIGQQGIQCQLLPVNYETGETDFSGIAQDSCAAVVVNQPNFFGVLEDVDAIVDAAHAAGALAIAVVNPTALALLKPPGEWGSDGADIACGEGQPFGVPLSSGGPYFGFMACKSKYVRQMPGRIIGRTTDVEGKTGYTLTLQAREQHIRRSKATSNICTNQGLMVTAATIYLSLLGHDGLHHVATDCHNKSHQLLQSLSKLSCKPKFHRPFFHEFVLQCQQPVEEVLAHFKRNQIAAGYPLGKHYPALADCLLVCVTETKTEADIKRYCDTMKTLEA